MARRRPPRRSRPRQAQAHELGVVAGQIHQQLNDIGPSVGLPAVTGRPIGRVIQPQHALAEARRFQNAASAAAGPFDQAVLGLLDQRIALIEHYASQRPPDDQPRGPHGWTHGDLQYRNVIWTGGRIGAVIDWDRIRVRPFAEEIARTATIQFGTPDGLDLARVSAFVAGYRTIIPIDDTELADGVHRLWWKRMSDFWLLRTNKTIMRACS
jgi:Ser/Thr protein kinase RdoA (MazF antagonist)